MLEQHRVSSIVRQQRLDSDFAECLTLGLLFIIVLFLIPGEW